MSLVRKKSEQKYINLKLRLFFMGGKTLRFPKRKKYVAPANEAKEEKETISQEEHERRVKMLKEMGILKS